MTSAVEAEVDVDVDVDADAYPRQTVCVCEMLTLLLAPGRILQRVCLSACLHCTLEACKRSATIVLSAFAQVGAVPAGDWTVAHHDQGAVKRLNRRCARR